MPTPTPRRSLPLRLLAALGAVLALAAGCGGGGGAGDPADDPAGRWVVLGSSTAAGVGATAGSSWAVQLSDRAVADGTTLLNRARPGAVTYQALPAATPRPADRPATLPAKDIEALVAASPRLLVLSFPSNDAMAGYSAAETVANLSLLQRRAANAGVPALLLSSQPRNDASMAQRAALRDVDRALAPVFGDCFVDVRESLSDSDGRIAPAYAAADGVHLNDAGHRLVFDRLSSVLAGGRCVRLRG